MASMMTKAGSSVRPSCGIQHRQPARPTPACCAVVGPVAQQTQQSVQQRKVPPPNVLRARLHWLQAALAAGVSALSITLAPAAMAAQEAMMVAEGEAPIVQVAWAALCVSFSASLAFVVWGRSGL